MRMTINGAEPKGFNFPDGQLHVDLTDVTHSDIYSIKCSIRNFEELGRLLLVKDVLSNRDYEEIHVSIGYLLGARMDRRIDANQPFTLKIVVDAINSAGFDSVTLFNVHSQVAESLLTRVHNILPKDQLHEVIKQNPKVKVVCPDKGAEQWLGRVVNIDVHCTKVRDSQTGRLSNFKVENPEVVQGQECLICDDLCDGGGTFVGLATKLREAGAKKVLLYVSHGIFSKGFELPGIDVVYTTDTYWKKEHFKDSKINVLEAF